MKRKPHLRTDEGGRPIDVEGINATPEAVGRAMLTPKAREMREKARQKRWGAPRASNKAEP